jgi:hypothetical protein
MGKSTGAGSLSLWMHDVQSTSFFDYSGPYYTGPAATLGAGLTGYQLNVIAQPYGKVFLAGACESVGTVGGYTQGGGHSPLSIYTDFPQIRCSNGKWLMVLEYFEKLPAQKTLISSGHFTVVVEAPMEWFTMSP